MAVPAEEVGAMGKKKQECLPGGGASESRKLRGKWREMGQGKKVLTLSQG